MHKYHYVWMHGCDVMLFSGENIMRNDDRSVTITAHTATIEAGNCRARAEDPHWTTPTPIAVHLEPVQEE